MDNERINFLINHPKEATAEDLIGLNDLIQEYPYSQMLHTLLAKIQFLQDNEDKNKALTTAAIYSSNRSILKEVIQSEGFLENIEDIPVYQDLAIVELEQENISQNGTTEAEGDKSDSASIFDEVLKNLQKLKSLREQFLFLEEDSESTEIKEPKQKFTAPQSEPHTEEPTKEKKTKRKKPISSSTHSERKRSKDKKEKIDQLLEKDLELDSKVNEFFISEIAQKEESSKKEISDKKVTEKEIIEKFIEEQPSIGNIQKELEKSQDEITKDLSEKSTMFGDNLVSENLAVIFLKQGKKERAMDIYRKLIWKLPQKKAYFAARIEEIKK